MPFPSVAECIAARNAVIFLSDVKLFIPFTKIFVTSTISNALLLVLLAQFETGISCDILATFTRSSKSSLYLRRMRQYIAANKAYCSINACVVFLAKRPSSDLVLGKIQCDKSIVCQFGEVAKIISNTTAANARALIELGPVAGAAAGVRQSISAGIGIASSVAAGAKAISQIKNADSGGSGGAGGARVPLPSSAGGASSIPSSNIDIGTSPETSVQNSAVQAYVVSGDITSNQEAEAKLNARRQISG